MNNSRSTPNIWGHVNINNKGTLFVKQTDNHFWLLSPFLDMYSETDAVPRVSHTSLSRPQLKPTLTLRSSSTCTSAVCWSAHVTRWSGIWRWTGACSTATQERTPSWEKRSSTRIRYFTMQGRASVCWFKSFSQSPENIKHRVKMFQQLLSSFSSLSLPLGLLLQCHSGGCAVAFFVDFNCHPQHSHGVSWHLGHTRHYFCPNGGV